MSTVEVVYASSEKQWKRELDLPLPCTVREVIQRSGVLEENPNLDLATLAVGIFSQRVTLETFISKPGERIEIYRALTMDPKVLRQKRARKS